MNRAEACVGNESTCYLVEEHERLVEKYEADDITDSAFEIVS